MNIADYLIITAIVFSAVIGAVRGFLREAIALATWLVALVLAWHYAPRFAPYLGGLLAAHGVRIWAARVVIAAAVLLVGLVIGAIVAHFVRVSIFSGTDRFLGFVFGAVRGAILLGVFVILAQLLRLNDGPWWRHSVLIPYGKSIANGLRALVGAGRL